MINIRPQLLVSKEVLPEKVRKVPIMQYMIERTLNASSRVSFNFLIIVFNKQMEKQ